MPPLADLVALIAPPTCVSCRAPLTPAAERVCPACRRALPWLRGVRCPRCGLPRHRVGGCPAAFAAFDAAWAPLAYERTARSLVRALKFDAALPLADLMAGHIATTLPPGFAGSALVIVPVPPQPRRRRQRGFDAADLLAAALAARLRLPVERVLRRHDRGRRQTEAGRTARRTAAPDLAVRRAPPAAVLLADDVHTTGATLDACARALKRAGAERVVAVTYARTL